MKNMVMFILAILLSSPGLASQDGFDISGNISKFTNVDKKIYHISVADMMNMKISTIKTSTNWTNSELFTGVLVEDILHMVGASGKTLKIYGLDDYSKRDDINELQNLTFRMQANQFTDMLRNIRSDQNKTMFLSIAIWVIAVLSSAVLLFMMLKYKRIAKEKEIAIRHKNIFISAMRHELTAPLQTIAYGVEIISKTCTDDDMINTINELNLASNKVSAQMAEIADYSRLEVGILEIKKDVFDIGELIKKELAQYNNNKNNNKIACSRVYAKKEQIIISDKWRLLKIIDNLLSNSVKFTNNGCVLVLWRIVKTKGGNILYIVINDNGIGFDMDDSEIMFEPFTQLDKAHKKYGMGLGLAIVKSTVELLGGKIRAKGKKNSGARFTIAIPVG